MRKSALNAFRHDFMSTYRRDKYEEALFNLSKTNAAPFLDADILKVNGEYYSIIDENAWNKLCELYQEDILEYEYRQEADAKKEELSDKYNLIFEQYLRKYHQNNYLNIMIGYNSWSVNMDAIFDNFNHFMHGNSSFYFSSLFSYQEYLDYHDKVKLYFEIRDYGNELHAEYIEEFDELDKELQIKYFGELKYARGSN